MAKEIQRLSAAAIAEITEPGVYLDGDGLSLQITEGGGRSWLFRYTFHGQRHEMGLGSLKRFTLADARKQAKKHRLELVNGIDPLRVKRALREQAQREKARSVTFKEEVEDYVEAHRSGWKSKKHTDQWSSTLIRYAYPVIGNVPVSAVNTDMVIKILTPIWSVKVTTADRVRNRIELVLSRAKSRGHRSGENPAAWRGHLDAVFPRPGKVRKKRHHPALHYDRMPEFMDQLRQRAREAPLAAPALAFTVLNAVRTSETILMTWSEVDFAIGVWTVPEEHTKTGRAHRIPLSAPALAILESLYKPDTKPDGHVFRGPRGPHLSNGAMLALLKRMGYRGKPGTPAIATTHGFRSSFRDWVGDKTDFPREVAEMALAHTLADDTEEAYRRSDAFEKRRLAMRAWAIYCCGTYAADGDLGALIAAEPRRANEAGASRSQLVAPFRMRQEAQAAVPGDRIGPPMAQPVPNPHRQHHPKIGRGLAHVLGMSDEERERYNNRGAKSAQTPA